MPPEKKMLVPPLKGYCEVAAFIAQPDGTSPSMLNVMMQDPAAERFRVTPRAGTGKYFFFDYSTLAPFVPPTLTIPADGTDDGPTINIPRTGCYTVTTDDGGTNNWDTNVSSPDNCGNTTIQIGGGGNPGTSTTGSITITDGGDTITIPINQPGGGTSSPPPPANPARPFIKVNTCVGNTFAFWVDAAVLNNPTIPNALVSLREGTTCYILTAQRGTAAQALPLRNWKDFIIESNCTTCAAAKNCYFIFRCVYNCGTATWGDVIFDHTACAALGDIPAVATWVRDHADATTVTYFNYVLGDPCTDTSHCGESPSVPAAPVITPTCPAICGACNMYVGQTITVTRPVWAVGTTPPPANDAAMLVLANTIPATLTYTVATMAGSVGTAVYSGPALDSRISIGTLDITCRGDLTPPATGISAPRIIITGSDPSLLCNLSVEIAWDDSPTQEVRFTNCAGRATTWNFSGCIALANAASTVVIVP